MRLSTYNGNFWLPVGARSPRLLRRRDRRPVPYNGDSCVKTTSLFCVLTACLVILFGCADPGAEKKSERGGCYCHQENQDRLVHGFVACGTVAERPRYFHG